MISTESYLPGILYIKDYFQAYLFIMTKKKEKEKKNLRLFKYSKITIYIAVPTYDNKFLLVNLQGVYTRSLQTRYDIII